MERLWGAFEPVPQANIRALAGGETVTAGGHTLQTAYTPGHASHHLAYYDEPSRIAFVGDVAGVSMPPAHVIVPPTPPPDIDVEAWEASVEKILAWHPEALFLTHFGLKSNPAIHLQELIERLRMWARLVKDLMAARAERGRAAGASSRARSTSSCGARCPTRRGDPLRPGRRRRPELQRPRALLDEEGRARREGSAPAAAVIPAAACASDRGGRRARRGSTRRAGRPRRSRAGSRRRPPDR